MAGFVDTLISAAIVGVLSVGAAWYYKGTIEKKILADVKEALIDTEKRLKEENEKALETLSSQHRKNLSDWQTTIRKIEDDFSIALPSVCGGPRPSPAKCTEERNNRQKALDKANNAYLTGSGAR